MTIRPGASSNFEDLNPSNSWETDPQYEEEEYIFKILCVGERGVGKTSLLMRYTHNEFCSNYKATIGVDWFEKILRFQNKTIKLRIWDIAGQEHMTQMTRVYYSGAVGAVVIHDLTREGTMMVAKEWKSDIDLKVHMPGCEKPIPVLLIGQKCDRLEPHDINQKEMTNFAVSNGFFSWIHCSAKVNMNVERAFDQLVKEILNQLPPSERLDEPEKTDTISLFKNGNSNVQGKDSSCSGLKFFTDIIKKVL